MMAFGAGRLLRRRRPSRPATGCRHRGVRAAPAGDSLYRPHLAPGSASTDWKSSATCRRHRPAPNQPPPDRPPPRLPGVDLDALSRAARARLRRSAAGALQPRSLHAGPDHPGRDGAGHAFSRLAQRRSAPSSTSARPVRRSSASTGTSPSRSSLDPNLWFPPGLFNGAMLDSRGEIVCDDVTNVYLGDGAHRRAVQVVSLALKRCKIRGYASP